MRAHFLFILLWGLVLAGCSKETEEFQTEALTDYLPTTTGKYITYRIDSTVFTNFGANVMIRSYQEKHQVDALITDNLGRPAYRVFRFLRDEAGAGAWQPVGSYFITLTDKMIEVTENNLRVLKLASPIKENYTWKAFRFYPNDPYGSYGESSTDDAMVDWESVYSNLGNNITLGGKTYANTITVEQSIQTPEVNVKGNFQVDNTQAYASQSYGIDKYAKGIGLVYQELIVWDYQPPFTSRSGYRGFGIKRSIIDHN